MGKTSTGKRLRARYKKGKRIKGHLINPETGKKENGYFRRTQDFIKGWVKDE